MSDRKTIPKVSTGHPVCEIWIQIHLRWNDRIYRPDELREDFGFVRQSKFHVGLSVYQINVSALCRSQQDSDELQKPELFLQPLRWATTNPLAVTEDLCRGLEFAPKGTDKACFTAG